MPSSPDLDLIEAPLVPKDKRVAVPSGRQMLFCLGAQKAGTTWLAANLAQSAECHFYPFEKELHYFDVTYGANTGMRGWKGEVIRRLLVELNDLDDTEYMRRMRRVQSELNLMRIYRSGPEAALAWMNQLQRYAEDARYLCDFTPDYAYCPPGAYQEMAEYVSPEGLRPKFLYIMRDPVDRYWSFLRMMVVHNDIRHDRAEERLRKWMSNDMDRIELARLNHCDYRYTVDQLDAHVPPEDVLYLFYETLFDPGVFEKICAFLEIAPVEPDRNRRVHEGLTLPFPEDRWDDVRSGLDDIYQFAFDRFGEAVPERWHRAQYR